MSQKRNPDDFGNSSADDKRRKSLTSFQSVVQEVMRQNKFKDILEPMLRRVVKEEVESAIKKHVISFRRNCEDVLPSESRSLKLKFLSTLYLPVFTGTRIEGEDGSAIKVALVDALTDEIVQYASESSAKIEIVVLEGDFDGDDGGNWTLEEFKNNIVREREGKKPILTGDVYMYLKEGIGSVGEISFTDNSSWTRSRRFRLGARAVGNYDGAGIREAKTESFIVRDHRGELYKKHHPPSLSDEVWRLEKIGKDGAFHKRLSLDRVNTVKDFLILLNLNPARLRNILGSGMSAKMWDVTIDHARTCVLDKRVYVYYSPNSQHSNGVVFNMVGHILGFYSESQYVPVDKLSETEKLDAQRMVIEAFQHRDGVLSFEDLSSLHGITPDTASSSKTRMHEQLDCGQPSASSPDMLSSLFSMGCMSSSDDFSLQGVDTLDLTYDHSDIPIQIPDPLLCETNSLLPSFHDDDHLGLFDPDYSLQPMNSGFDPQANLLNTYDELIVSHSSTDAVRGPGQRRWRILSSVITWFSVRKDVLIKRMKGEYTIKKCRDTISFHGDHNCKY